MACLSGKKRTVAGYLRAQDTYYVGYIKGVGKIYQQTFIDIYTRVAFAKPYDRKNAVVAAGTLNDGVIPFLEEEGIDLLRILTDRGAEYCGAREHHEYQLYLTIEDIDRTRTKARHPQTNGICERFHKTIKEEFYSIAFRKRMYDSIGMEKHPCRPGLTVRTWPKKKELINCAMILHLIRLSVVLHCASSFLFSSFLGNLKVASLSFSPFSGIFRTSFHQPSRIRIQKLIPCCCN